MTTVLHYRRYRKMGRGRQCKDQFDGPAEEGKKEISYITEEDTPVVSVTDLEIQICDLYAVGHNPKTIDSTAKEVPL